MTDCKNSSGDKKCGEEDMCSPSEIGLELKLPANVAAPDISIDIAVLDQHVPAVDLSSPDTIINLAPLPMTYHQLHHLFYKSNNEFGFNKDALTDLSQSVWKNTINPFLPIGTPIPDASLPYNKNQYLNTGEAWGIRNIDLVSFDRQYVYESATSLPKPFNLYQTIMDFYALLLH